MENRKYKHRVTGEYVSKVSESFYMPVAGGGGSIPVRFIENSSDWELVEPPVPVREWTILEFKHVDGSIWKLLEAKYRMGDMYSKGYPLERMLKDGPAVSVENGTMAIHKVQYKDQVITVGDRIKHTKDDTVPVQVVDGIILNEYDNILLITKQYKKGININKVVKAEVLFTTIDGVDICSDTTPVWLFSTASYEWVAHRNIPKKWHDKVIGNEVWKIFSTKEAANKWIEENKPKPALLTTEDGVTTHDHDQSLWGLDTTTWQPALSWDIGAILQYKNKNYYKWFYNHDAMNEYILMNKPLFSLKEIEKYISLSTNISNKLKELAQTKLNV